MGISCVYKNVAIVVLTIAVLAAVSFLCTCSRGGRSGITNAAASLGGARGDALSGSQSAGSAPASTSPANHSATGGEHDSDHPRVDSLNRENGISLETESGVFTLFVVDKYNRPNREAAAGFEMAFDASA